MAGAAGDPAIAPDAPARRSYEALLASAADVTQDHDVLVALQVDPRRAAVARRGRAVDAIA